MPEPRSERIPDFMEPTGETDQHLGAEYRCTLCGARRWTAWANASRHEGSCPELEDGGQ